jgi:hypothetical protein
MEASLKFEYVLREEEKIWNTKTTMEYETILLSASTRSFIL